MKLRVHDIKFADRLFTEPGKFQLFIPTEDQLPRMIEWLEEYGHEPYTEEHAVEVYIRTALFYGSTKLEFKVDVLLGSNAEVEVACSNNQPFSADIFDSQYETYRSVKFDMQIPDSVVIDESSMIFVEYDEDLDTFVFEALLHNLPITISNVERIPAV